MSLRPKTRSKVGVKKDHIRYIAGQHDNLTYEQVLALIEKMLMEILNLTLGNLELWIETHVPKRTGQLRDNLLRNLKSSRVRDGIMRLIIGTNIDYATDVNQMSTAQVRHSGTWREHSGKKAYAYYYGHYGPIYLEDPEAEGNFFDKLIEFAKERITINLARTKAKYFKSMQGIQQVTVSP